MCVRACSCQCVHANEGFYKDSGRVNSSITGIDVSGAQRVPSHTCFMKPNSKLRRGRSGKCLRCRSATCFFGANLKFSRFRQTTLRGHRLNEIPVILSLMSMRRAEQYSPSSPAINMVDGGVTPTLVRQWDCGTARRLCYTFRLFVWLVDM